MSNDRKNYLLNWLLVILVALIAWLWQGVDGQLTQLTERLRQVELNQTKLLTRLNLEPYCTTKPPAPVSSAVLPSLSSISPIGKK